MSLRLRGFIVLSLATAGCSAKDLSSELDTVRSWTSSARLAAAQRERHAINATVVRQLADRARDAAAKSAQSLAQLASTDSDRVEAQHALDSLRTAIAALDRQP